MVATIYAGFNTDRIGALTAVFDDSVISPTTVTIIAGRYAHRDLSSVMGTGLYTDLALALQTAVAVASPTSDFTVTFDATTRRYTFTNASNPYQLDFTSAAGQRLAKALGFTANNTLGSGSGYACTITSTTQDAVSDVLPYYLVPLARDEPSGYSRPYEPDGMIKREQSVNGNAFSIEPLTIMRLIDFSTLFMPLANVFVDDAASSQPWTIEHLCRHARGTEPVLFDFVNTGDLVCKLSKRNAGFTRESRELSFQQADYHGLWSYKWVELQLLGHL